MLDVATKAPRRRSNAPGPDHEGISTMATRNRTEQRITARHARSCPARDGGGCDCTPTWQPQVWDARAGKRLTRSFTTITAARQWRQDAASALRAGTLTAERGATLDEAAEEWLAAARAAIVRNRSGGPYKRSAIRGYEQNLRARVLPELGHERLREITLPQLQRFVDRLAADGVPPPRSPRRSHRCARSTGVPASSARFRRTLWPGSLSLP